LTHSAIDLHSGKTAVDRTERLLDLVALLLDAQEPVPWSELKEAFPEDYGSGTDEATERKFERDKAELLELGIPLTYVQGDEDRKDGYLLDRDAYYLPDVGFTPEEMALLYAAGSAALASGAFPGRQDLQHALRKIGFFADPNLPSPRVRMELGAVREVRHVPQHLEALWTASSTRKSVTLVYASPRSPRPSQRTVDPYGLALRRGIWSLVGFCHERQALRTFHVHRIRDLKMNASKPRTADFQVPADFRLDDHVPHNPWQFRIEPPTAVTLALSGGLADRAEAHFPEAKVTREGKRTTATLTVTNLDPLLRHLLTLSPDVRVVDPPAARARIQAMAEAVRARHRGVGR
jgi:proteasome accessory factor B